MNIYQLSMLTRSVLIPMMQMGGDVTNLLEDELRMFEGKCIEEGYVQKNSIEIINYSCGVIKGKHVLIQVVFKCKIANPLPGQVLDCIVETNTRAGIKARLHSKEDPFVIFLARDHHNLISAFSDIKEHEKIKVTVLGQRFEVNDPKISIIATLKLDSIDTDLEPDPDSPKIDSDPIENDSDPIEKDSDPIEKDSEPIEKDSEIKDTFVFSSTSAIKPKPGKGVGEIGNPANYPELDKKVNWRQQLSHFDVSEFQCDGSPDDGIVFPPGSKWRTLEHYSQACKLSLSDKNFANLLRSGEKYGNGDGKEARELRKGKQKNPDKHPVLLTPEQLQQWDKIEPNVMYIGALAKFSQNEEKKKILCATKNAILLHNPGRVSKDKYVRFTYYERVRSELC